MKLVFRLTCLLFTSIAISQTTTVSSNNNVVGLEHNMLFNADKRYSVTQEGNSLPLNVLFDGSFEVAYTPTGISPQNPYTVTIENLPKTHHTQIGAWIGWSTRYYRAINFKIEGYDEYESANVWRTIADYSAINYNSNQFVVKLPVNGVYSKLKFTFYRTDDFTNGRLGLSELFFLHPEGTTPYKGLFLSEQESWIKNGASLNYTTGYVGIGTTSPKSLLDINANGSVPIIRGNGGYIPTGLRFIDDSYTQSGQIKEWALYKGNSWLKGLGFVRYDAINPCNGGICDVSLFLADNGNIGIGNTLPNSKLDLGTNYSDPSTFPNKICLWSNGSNNYFGFGVSNTSLDYFSQGQHRFFVGYNGTPGREVFTLKASGNASLQGKFEAKEIKVTTSPTADFVFADDYALPKLEEVEKHIKDKKHLPEIASAKEMEKEGVNVGEFQIKLLQKIEELTLYVIEQNKKNIEQEEKIKKLEAQLKSRK